MIKILLTTILALAINLVFAQKIELIKIDDLPKEVTSINCLELQNDSILWIGTNYGLIAISDKNMQVYADSNATEMYKINHIYIDTDGTKWLGNYNNCIIKFSDDKNNEIIDFRNELGKDIGLITSIQKQKDIIWATTSSSYILRYDINSKQKQVFNIGDDIDLYSIVTTDNKTIWVSTSTGLATTTDLKKWKFEKNIATSNLIKKDNSKGIFAIGRAANNETVVMNLNSKKNKWNIVEIHNNPDKYIKFNNFDFDALGNYWFATNYGIIQYDINRQKCFVINQRNFEDFDIRIVNSIAVQGNNIIWIASNGRELYKIIL